MKGKPFKDAPGRCLKCGNELKLNKENAYCSRECEEQDMGYYTKSANSKIGVTETARRLGKTVKQVSDWKESLI